MKKKLVKLLAVWGCCFAMATSAGAQAIPEQFNYQSSVSDSSGQPLADGTYSIEFRLWTAPTDGAVVWGETYTLSVSKGVLNVVLGVNGQPLACVAAGTCTTPLSSTLGGAFAGTNRYLGITVLTGSYPSEFSPRQQILSVPFAMNGVPAGSITAFAGQVDKIASGWLLCDGRAVSSQAYPALFQTIGTSWGNGASDADPNTDFNLPNFQGRFLWGSKDGSITNIPGGAETATLTQYNLPPHVHSFADYHYHDSDPMSANYATPTGDTTGRLITTTHNTNNNLNANSAPFSILPPNLTVNYLVKY